MDDQTSLHRLADSLAANAHDLEAELDWLGRSLQLRLSAYFAEPSRSPELPSPDLPAPTLEGAGSPYAAYLRRHHIVGAERLLMLLALAPHLRPQLLDVLWTRNDALQRGFTEFGGLPCANRGAFLPTGETATFLLGGDALASRFAAMQLLRPQHRLAQRGLLQLAPPAPGAPALSGALLALPSLLVLATQGAMPGMPSEDAQPDFDAEFPARRVRSAQHWEDLALPAATLQQLHEIRDWMRHGPTLLDSWGMRGRLRPGYTCLFTGPPGTGKTLSASLLGQLCDCDVYRIDLSLVVSKYIGETEKNLGRVFDQAERRGWILFFDEADALFGKRTRVDDAHDRFANQEVSYLLQRIEDFEGVVILSTNLQHNIDDAFLRRFQSVVNFTLPRPAERLRIWRSALPTAVPLGAGLDLEQLAERHELTGGTIVNAARHAALRALARGDTCIGAMDVDEGIRREMYKEGRAL